MAALLTSGEEADVIFKVENERIPAHLMILKIRSPELLDLVENAVPVGADGAVEVEGISPPVFRAVLRFVYSDELPEVR
jgi:speckle-type POZ protein